MPRIPSFQRQQELDPDTRGMPKVSLSNADNEAEAKQGAALAGFGAMIASTGQAVAATWGKRQDEAARFSDGVQDDARRNELTAYLAEAREKIPETGRGFHDSVMPKLDEIAEKRFAGMTGSDAAKYREKWQAERIGWSTKAAGLERDTGSTYAGRQIDQAVQQGAVEITSNPAASDTVRERVADRIKNAPYWTEAQKAEALVRWEKTSLTTEALQKFKADPITASRELGVPLKGAALPMDAPSAITAAAKELGISPVDLATVISYETGGTFDPSIRGGAGRRHIGLIQFGIPEQQKYGASQSQTFSEQMSSVVGYLKDRGLKPGMSLLDLYSTINAGAPGLSHRSDANNGGAPGTVKDKVERQMGGHRAKAMALLGDSSAAAEVNDGGLEANKRYAALDVTTRERIVNGAAQEQSAMLREEDQRARQTRYATSKQVEDDVASLRATGKGMDNVTAETIEANLGSEKVQEWRERRDYAQRAFTATDGLDTLTGEQIQARVDQYRPTGNDAGAGFGQRAQLYREVSERADTVLKQRFADPAAAVDNLPPVVNARTRLSSENTVQAREGLIEARLGAQAMMDVPKYAQSPISVAEARQYASKMRPLARGQADVANQNEVIEGVVREIQDRYGKYAKDVLQRVLYQVTLKKDASEVLATAIERMSKTDSGPLVRTTETRKVETEAQADTIGRSSGAPAYSDPMGSGIGVAPSDAPPSTGRPRIAPGPAKGFDEAVKALEADPEKMMPFFVQRFGRERVPAKLRERAKP